MTSARLTAGIALLLIFSVQGTAQQQRSNVSALMQDARVQSALERAKASEPQTLDDQTRFCEVPAPPFKEAARGEVLKREFSQLGLRNVRVDRVGNVIADRPGSQPRPRVVIAAHLDTVFPEETKLTVTRRGNIFSGPGIGDNCRGLAVLVAIARSLNQANIETPGAITFVANVGEEGLGDLRGMKALFEETMKGGIDKFVGIDNADINIGVVGVGSHRYRVTFKGPGGHSFAQFGMPSPVGALGRAVAKIDSFQMPGEPKTTFNVGRIGGGTSVNAIPADAWMEVDLRSSEPAALASLDAKFREAVDQAVVEENARWRRPGVVTAVKELVGDRPAGTISANAPIVVTAVAVARELGLTPAFSESSSDANFPLSLKIPAITIGGGGTSMNAHALNESFDATDSWKGTQNALLLTIALAR